MVKINRIIEISAELWNGIEKVGVVDNILTLNDVLIQIKQNKLTGYYFMFDGKKIAVDSDGRVENRVRGFFTTLGDQLRELI